MGLTEAHWFEDEEPELTERQLENAIIEIENAYRRGYQNGYADRGKWISVDDALPEEHGDYLAIIDGRVKPVVFDYARRWARYTYKGIVVDDSVTHWMPLPKGVEIK